jgi:hypothetical protein
MSAGFLTSLFKQNKKYEIFFVIFLLISFIFLIDGLILLVSDKPNGVCNLLLGIVGFIICGYSYFEVIWLPNNKDRIEKEYKDKNNLNNLQQLKSLEDLP